ncbi:MAG: cupin domain-containing protein [Bryobacterales bacterium]|nr:cupin domain-containing protein [Bryobacterales bacterium]
MGIHRWDAIQREQLNPHVERQAIHSGRMTMARLYMKSGAVVQRHHHENEQCTVLETGRLRFIFDHGEQELAAGEVMEIPPHEPHSVVALEDSVALDLFAPRREDWLRGDDAYLRTTAGVPPGPAAR